MMLFKASSFMQSAVDSGFSCTDNAVIRQFRTREIRLLLPTSMVAGAEALEDGSIKKPVVFLFKNRMVAVVLVNGGHFL